MTKTAFLVMAGAILCTTVTAFAQQESRGCDECGCDQQRRSGGTYQRRMAGDDRYQNRPLFDSQGAQCEDGQCDINSFHPRSGCQNGNCEPGSRQQDLRAGSFPYLSERQAIAGRTRRLDDPFRPAGQPQQQYREFDRRDSRQMPTRFEPVSFESQRPVTRSISWMTDIQRAAELAGQENRPILLQVSADWCPHCQRMQRETYRNPSLTNLINEQFVAIAVDADQQRDFVEQMGIQSLPTTLVVGSDLRVLNRLQGFQSAEQLLQTLSR